MSDPGIQPATVNQHCGMLFAIDASLAAIGEGCRGLFHPLSVAHSHSLSFVHTHSLSPVLTHLLTVVHTHSLLHSLSVVQSLLYTHLISVALNYSLSYILTIIFHYHKLKSQLITKAEIYCLA